ncbi:tetratricopeptide repeat protein [Leptospira congkakensis]|uniref:Tetratricopeptide repeat protein n=1 Tax=Leptospira congkakensis TaxID=2484932 RepID=A0A4Z1ADT0_9LEPT|nr:tetratricopeptide repeat protein [Leptospira congkakensis]TGL88926.1 tetratricopeptide repeat protein [Leptospira congkakensis]TGL93428.1 tetratricopeptide repeat protein [Leptospira congkakensis]
MLNLSRFQKNTLLTFSLLAFVAYAPLYYSIRNAIKKESLPVTYESPESVSFFSLGDFEIKGKESDPKTLKILAELIDFEFQKVTGGVYLGKENSLSLAKKLRADFVFFGSLEWKEKGIEFTPKLKAVEQKSTYTGQSAFLPYEERGKLVSVIYQSQTHLLDETIRLHRLMKRSPEWKIPSADEFLSESEFVRLSEYDPKLSLDEKNSLLKTLDFPSEYLQFIKISIGLEKRTEESLKEIWRSVGGNSNFSPYTRFYVAKNISEFYFAKKEFSKTIEYASAARKERELLKSVFHSDYADTISSLGKALVLDGKKEEAVYYLTSAKKLYDTLGLLLDPNSVENSYFYGLLLYDLSQAELASYELSSIRGQFKGIHSLYLDFNLAKVYYDLGRYTAALSLLQDQRKIIMEEGYANHDIALYSYNLYAASLYKSGKWSIAKSIWESFVQAKSIYGIEEKPYHRYALFNLALLSKLRNNTEQMESYYKQYTRLSPYGQIVDLPTNDRFEIGKPIYPYTWDSLSPNSFTELEEKTIRSYTGRYLFNGQDEEIRARTYENRLEDTNLFLDDLLNTKAFLSKPMSALRKTLFGDLKRFEKGNQIVFFDIGPALNHPEYPGVTSLAVAKHFSGMEVVLWELPGEVDLFLKKVKPELKDRLYAFPNIRILSADGVGEFQTVYTDPNNWILRNRPIPNLKGKTIIIRAANSIDIYEPYTKILPHFQNIGKELKTNPVLYFFNRTILLKPAGKEKFILIGNQSIRGFHHNFQSLDRNGEPPYSILPFTVSEEVNL